jgi:hypothetical protein
VPLTLGVNNDQAGLRFVPDDSRQDLAARDRNRCRAISVDNLSRGFKHRLDQQRPIEFASDVRQIRADLSALAANPVAAYAGQSFQIEKEIAASPRNADVSPSVPRVFLDAGLPKSIRNRRSENPYSDNSDNNPDEASIHGGAPTDSGGQLDAAR